MTFVSCKYRNCRNPHLSEICSGGLRFQREQRREVIYYAEFPMGSLLKPLRSNSMMYRWKQNITASE